MKALITTFFLFFSIALNAQYQSFFGQSSTQWTELLSNLGFTITTNFTVTGDTTIGGLQYKKVTPSNMPDLFLREDTTTGKLWKGDFLTIGSFFREHLIADYALTLGDLFLLHFDNGQTIPIDTAIVDSVYFLGGRKHIRFDFNSPFIFATHKLTFIEGVGTNFGLWYQPFAFNLFPILLCKFRDNVQEYANTFFNGSCSITGLESEEVQDDVKLIKQGDGYVIQVEPSLEIMEIKLMDMQGRLIQAEYMQLASGEAYLNLNGLSSGFYIVYITSNKVQFSAKLVKM